MTLLLTQAALEDLRSIRVYSMETWECGEGGSNSFPMPKRKKKPTPSQRAERKRRKKETEIIFINGKLTPLFG